MATKQRKEDQPMYRPSKRIVERMRELNFAYCWSTARDKTNGTNWYQVNRHLWRIQAMYFGGDVFLASWPNTVPHQKLWPTKQFNGERIPAYKA